MIILGIESTCDETAAALVEDGRHLLSNVISTSVKVICSDLRSTVTYNCIPHFLRCIVFVLQLPAYLPIHHAAKSYGRAPAEFSITLLLVVPFPGTGAK